MAKPWGRYEQNFINHPKFVVLSAGAICLWMEGKNYCDMHLTDGLIPREALRTFRFNHRARVDELKDAVDGYSGPLWEDHPIGLKMHDYLDHNDCREVVLARIEKADSERASRSAYLKAYRAEKKAGRAKVREPRSNQVREQFANSSRTVFEPDKQKQIQKHTKKEPGVLDSELAKEDDPEFQIDRRAAAFMERYPKIYAECRSGAHYHVKEARDFDTFVELARGWPDDQRLDNMLKVFLYLDRRDVLNKPGTPGQFRHHAPECDALLRANGR